MIELPTRKGRQAEAALSVRSAANDPRVLDFRLHRARSGAVLWTRLEFANDCYAEAGATAMRLRAPDSDWLALRQRFPAKGCPEIHRPVTVDAEVYLSDADRPIDILACGESSCRVKPAEASASPSKDGVRIDLEAPDAFLPIVSDVRVETRAAKSRRMGVSLSLVAEIPSTCRGEPTLHVLENRIGDASFVTEWAYLSVGGDTRCVEGAADARRDEVRVYRELRSDLRRVMLLANPRPGEAPREALRVELVDGPS